MKTYKGKCIFPGVAFGNGYVIADDDFSIDLTTTDNSECEWQTFLEAREAAINQLARLVEDTAASLGEDESMIIDVQQMILLDEDYSDFVKAKIFGEKKTASYGSLMAESHFKARFESLDDEYMKARAVDVADACRLVTKILLGVATEHVLTKPSIIIASDLTPSDTLKLDKSMIRAFVMQKGSGTSHTAILARIMSIPCIINADIPLDTSMAGVDMAVDGKRGLCFLNPDETTKRELMSIKADEDAHKKTLDEMKGKPSVTKDGRIVKLVSNIGSPDDVKYVLENDSEGIGLFRSEFLYLGRANLPSEDEQFEAYKTVAEAMGDKNVVIRTLDIGADKQAAYLNLDKEENPALGIRGIRLCFEKEDVFITQLRAIYRASAFGNLSIMFPMIASVWEVKLCKDFLTKVENQLESEGIQFNKPSIGIMIETPASVMIADELAKEVEFFSVGTNDLTQYTLACDRVGNKLDRYIDPHHPAVLRMLEIIAKSAKSAGISAGICGELAADTTLTKSLVDMGFDKLSVSPVYTLLLRAAVRSI